MSVFKKILKEIKKKEQIPIPKLVNESKKLDGKTAIITGGASGIGFSIARDFVDNGCNVILFGRNEEKLKASSLKLGDKCKYVVCDLKEIKSLNAAFDKALTKYPGSIDILVNCAGIIATTDFLKMSEDEFDNIINTNVKATYFMTQIVGNYMINKGIRGHILNLSSSSAMRPAWSAYEISKWSIRGFTLGAADILSKYGITVNAIAPGPTFTPMLGKKEGDSIYVDSNCMKRFTMPDEVASLATFLCSEIGNMIVGDTVYITGGAGNIKSHI